MTDAGKRLVEAVENCCATWDHNCGRVFESMGRDNPKASAIDKAVADMSSALTAFEVEQDELVGALVGIFEIIKEEKRMKREYPAGTCNAEDAWRDFSRDEEAAWNKARAVLAKHRKEQ